MSPPRTAAFSAPDGNACLFCTVLPAALLTSRSRSHFLTVVSVIAGSGRAQRGEVVGCVAAVLLAGCRRRSRPGCRRTGRPIRRGSVRPEVSVMSRDGERFQLTRRRRCCWGNPSAEVMSSKVRERWRPPSRHRTRWVTLPSLCLRDWMDAIRCRLTGTQIGAYLRETRNCVAVRCCHSPTIAHLQL